MGFVIQFSARPGFPRPPPTRQVLMAPNDPSASLKVTLGSAPDSWGVWFPAHEQQTPWERFLDELAQVGYHWTELGPYGYLPTDVSQLRDELAKRDVKLTGTFYMPNYEDDWDTLEPGLREVGSILQPFEECRYLVMIDDVYTDLIANKPLRPSELTPDQWKKMCANIERTAKIALEEFGLISVFHHHAETHVETPEQCERLLADTDERYVKFCLDTGHYAYRGGDPIAFMKQHHARTPYLHLKSVEAEKRDKVNSGGMTFAEAVADDMFVEPSEGVIDFLAFRDVLRDVNYEGFGIVEQDMFPVPTFDKPLPIAQRTRAYLEEIGLGKA